MTFHLPQVPMATGITSPVWPLPDVTRKRWTFGASRAQGKRRHAGVDLYARRGSIVLAPEDGLVVAWQRFNGPNAHALLIALDTGPVVLLGEIEPKSWLKYNAGPGQRVQAGQAVAEVGINPGGSQMLHLEMYATGTTRNHRWYTGKPPPPQLLNPTQYLKSASALDVDQTEDPGDDNDDAGEVEDDDTADDVAEDPSDLPDIHPEDPGDLPTDPNSRKGAFFGLGIIFLIAAAMGNR